MLGFGESLYLWRVERGLTQAALARRAGLPRPTMSALERGRLDPTLRTIRRVAAGVGVPPGILVNGEPPPRISGQRLSRASLERIATELLGTPQRLTGAERQVTAMLREILKHRLAVARARAPSRGSARRERWSWVALASLLTPAELRSVVSRIEKRGQAHRLPR